jgi:hypothetical protein
MDTLKRGLHASRHTFGIDPAANFPQPLPTMKTIRFILPLLFPLTAHAADPVVKIAGVQAIIDDGSKEFEHFKTLNSDQGHQVVLIIRSGDKQIVGFDDDKAALKIGGAAAKCRFFGGGDSSFSKDRLALRLEFTAKGDSRVSADGTLKVTGELPVVFATGKEETRSTAFTVAAGTEVKFSAEKATAMPTLKVKSSGKPKWGDDPFEIVISTNRKADEFAGIRFYTKDGKPVDAERGSTSWMGFGNKGSGEISYTFKSAQTDLILAVESWSGREEKSLKVDLAAGLAMPKP